MKNILRMVVVSVLFPAVIFCFCYCGPHHHVDGATISEDVDSICGGTFCPGKPIKP